MRPLQYGTLSTGQFSYNGPDRVDITLKTYMKIWGFMGPGCFLVPTRSLEQPDYELVGGVKHYQLLAADRLDDHNAWVRRFPPLSPEQYTERYLEILRSRYRRNPDYLLSVFMLPGLFFPRPETTLVCYCGEGFCHRHIAAEVLGKIALRHGVALLGGGERATKPVATQQLLPV